MIVGVAAVDDHVVAFEERDEGLQRRIDHGGRHHHPDGAGRFQLLGEIFERRRANRAFFGECLHGFRMDVVNDALVAGAHKAPHHVGSHPAQSDHAQFHGFTVLLSGSRSFSDDRKPDHVARPDEAGLDGRSIGRTSLRGGRDGIWKGFRGPIARTAMMLEQSLLLSPIELCRGVIRRSILDGLASQTDRHRRVLPTHGLDPLRRDQHLVAAPPVGRVDDQVTNRPGMIVDEKLLHVTDVTVSSVDVQDRARLGNCAGGNRRLLARPKILGSSCPRRSGLRSSGCPGTRPCPTAHRLPSGPGTSNSQSTWLHPGVTPASGCRCLDCFQPAPW